jgi:predicted permease
MAVLFGLPTTIRHFLRNLLRRSRVEDELDRELDGYLELLVAEKRAAGLSAAEARREARRDFGGRDQVVEQVRDARIGAWAEEVGQDLRYGLRALAKSPGFTAVAVLTLAVGIGASAAVFGLADAALFRRLPVSEPGDLVGFRWFAGPGLAPMLIGSSSGANGESTSTSFSVSTFRTVAERGRRYADVFGFADMYRISVTFDGRAEIGSGMLVSGNYFDALGVVPAAGRALTDDDDRPGAAPVAMISHAYWQQRGADEGVIGRTITINGVTCTIVGVMARGFNGTAQVDQTMQIAVPLSMRGTLTREFGPVRWEDQSLWWVLMMGRLRGDITSATAHEALETLVQQSVAADEPALPAQALPRLVLFPGWGGQEETRASMRTTISMMVLVVVVVLLVVCANMANLLQARGSARAREVAVRAAIGASRRRLVRQFLTEALLLALLGAAGGLLVAQWLSAALVPALSSRAAPAVDLSFDWRFLLFTTLTTTLCTVLFGLWPACRSTRVSLTRALHGASRGGAARRRVFGVSPTLVAVQMALCLFLLATTGLLVRSVRNLERVPLGFDPSNVLLVDANPSLSGYEDEVVSQYYAAALDSVRALPGVRSATLLGIPLISGNANVSLVTIPGGLPPAEARRDPLHRVAVQSVGQGFFETFGIPILRGRAFETSDGASRPVAVVNRLFVEQYFPDTDPLGRQFRLGGSDPTIVNIVGVVANAKYSGLRRDTPRTVYLYPPQPRTAMTFAIKSGQDPLALAPAIRDAIKAIDASVPLSDLRTQIDQIARSVGTERVLARLAALLGAVVLLLAGMGLYGVVAYSVARRGPEIAIRMALGAERRQVRRMVLGDSIGMALLGVAVGIPMALTGTRLVQNALFGLEARDPFTLAGATVVMVGVALLAAYIPARQASQVDPLVAIRSE